MLIMNFSERLEIVGNFKMKAYVPKLLLNKSRMLSFPKPGIVEVMTLRLVI